MQSIRARLSSNHVASKLYLVGTGTSIILKSLLSNSSQKNLQRSSWSVKQSVVCAAYFSVMSSTSKKCEPPVVVVLGSTASGKSKLAIDLASHVPGEIISADSMQVYEGLDILTNKATQEEMTGIPHHMIGVVDRLEKYDVTKFRDTALPLVEKILADGKVPYIVGGTNYYIESLLWKVLIDADRSSSDHQNSGEESNDEVITAKRLKLDEVDASNPLAAFMLKNRGNFTEHDVTEKWSHTEIHQLLQQVDPERAMRFHPNDVRKSLRSLKVFFRTGRKHSDLIEQQCNQSGSGSADEEDVNGADTIPKNVKGNLGGPLRFSNCICFWIQADREVLNARIDGRADTMKERGLRQELDEYVDQINRDNIKWDFEEGQLQSIGVKEFESYIKLPADERNTEQGQKLFEEGLTRLQIVTRQYAKRQVQWVNQRFLKSSRRQLPPVYGLDGNKTDKESWEQNVFTPALLILNAHMEENLELPLLKEKLLPVSADDKNEDFITRKCDVCDRILVGNVQWQEHMNSRKHWKMVKRSQKLEEKSKSEAGTSEKIVVTAATEII